MFPSTNGVVDDNAGGIGLPEPSKLSYHKKLVAVVPGSKFPTNGLVSEQNSWGVAGAGSAGAVNTPTCPISI